jgi:thioredoxin-like negative regulator of GroEL
MCEKSRKRLTLEQSLAQDPTDPFLRYGLAVLCLREGDVEEGRRGLLALIADESTEQVAAHQQLGQSYAETGETDAARETLRTGIAKAQAAGNSHAASEMMEIVASLR